MRKSIVILGACLVLVLGMTGCDDDDDLFNVPDVPIDQQVTAVTEAVVTGISTVTAIANAVSFSTSANGVGALGTCTDLTSVICTGGGPPPPDIGAQLCDAQIPPLLNLIGCNVLGVGELEGFPNPAATLDASGDIFVQLSIDDSIFLIGTLINLGQFGCPAFGYQNFTVDSQGVAATMNSSSVSQCLGEPPDGTVFVDVDELSLQLKFLFDGSDIIIVEVFTSPKGASTICTVDLSLGTTICG